MINIDSQLVEEDVIELTTAPIKIVSQLDASGYFLGAAVADESPLEPGVYLIPGGCEDVEPPEVPEGQRARLVGGVWQFEVENFPPDSDPLPDDPKEQILRQIDTIERQTLMNRAIREMAIGIAEEKAASIGMTPQQLYMANLGYQKVKDVDNQIAALRSKL
jgi:hypothetical protein